jgi:hypothetical protein
MASGELSVLRVCAAIMVRRDPMVSANRRWSSSFVTLLLIVAASGRATAQPPPSINVDPTGKVGIGTSTPQQQLQVTSASSPTVRLEQTSPARSWDIGGSSTSFFINNATAGTNAFTILSGAPNNSFYITATGRVGIGGIPTTGAFTVFGGATTDVAVSLGPDAINGPAFNFGYTGASFASTSVGFFNIRPDVNATAPNPSIRFMTNDTQRMILDRDGQLGLGAVAGFDPAHPIHHTNGAHLSSTGSWNIASSRKHKTDVQDLEIDSAARALVLLRPVTFRHETTPDDLQAGFIAEDVPELVATPDRTSLSPMDIVAVLTRVVQEQQRTISDLQDRLTRVEAEPKESDR